MLIFSQKHASKRREDEVLKTFNETAQSGNLLIFKLILHVTNII